MTTTERLLTAATGRDPTHRLRAVVLQLADEGQPKHDIVASLEMLLPNLRQDRHEDAADAVLDVLDGLAGWCQADARLDVRIQ